MKQLQSSKKTPEKQKYISSNLTSPIPSLQLRQPKRLPPKSKTFIYSLTMGKTNKCEKG